MHGVGGIFAAIIRASGRIPQISVVLGPAAGGAAYGPALTDLVIMSDQGRVFVTGPSVVQAVTGEQIDMAGLGGPEPHSRKSGVVHVVADSEAEAFRRTRRITGLLSSPEPEGMAPVGGHEDLRMLLPPTAKQAYDVRPLIGRILDPAADGERFEELQPRWAPNMVIGLGRLAGGRSASSPTTRCGKRDAWTR